MRNIIKVLISVLVTSVSPTTFSTNYENHRSLILTTLAMEHELALKVIPVVRTFISPNGHIAHVKGSNQIVILAKPETQKIFAELFVSLDLKSFDKSELQTNLENKFGTNHSSSMTTQVIHLSTIDADTLIPALRTLISKEGKLSSVSSGKKIRITDYPNYTNEMSKLIKQLDSQKAFKRIDRLLFLALKD